jgi:hypothetical protein
VSLRWLAKLALLPVNFLLVLRGGAVRFRVGAVLFQSPKNIFQQLQQNVYLIAEGVLF